MKRQKKYVTNEIEKKERKNPEKGQNRDKQSFRCRVQITGYKDAQWPQWEPKDIGNIK